MIVIVTSVHEVHEEFLEVAEIDLTEEIFRGVQGDFFRVGVVALVQIIEDDVHQEVRMVGTADQIHEWWEEFKDFFLDFVFFSHELAKKWDKERAGFRRPKGDADRRDCANTYDTLFHGDLLHFLKEDAQR